MELRKRKPGYSLIAMIMPILAVSDLEASIDFYTSKLGFELAFSMNGPDGVRNFAFVALGKAHIGLQADPSLASPRGQGAVFMVYVPDETDIDAFYAGVVSRGTTIAREIADMYWGDRTFTVADPDGFVVTIAKTTQQMDMGDIEAAHQASG